ncbi:hypothetical protein BGZ94_001479 [Podila epigama]|nr:hypothetical protein BGZ94_001479 [Podila epigama]
MPTSVPVPLSKSMSNSKSNAAVMTGSTPPSSSSPTSPSSPSPSLAPPSSPPLPNTFPLTLPIPQPLPHLLLPSSPSPSPRPRPRPDLCHSHHSNSLSLTSSLHPTTASLSSFSSSSSSSSSSSPSPSSSSPSSSSPSPSSAAHLCTKHPSYTHCTALPDHNDLQSHLPQPQPHPHSKTIVAQTLTEHQQSQLLIESSVASIPTSQHHRRRRAPQGSSSCLRDRVQQGSVRQWHNRTRRQTCTDNHSYIYNHNNYNNDNDDSTSSNKVDAILPQQSHRHHTRNKATVPKRTTTSSTQTSKPLNYFSTVVRRLCRFPCAYRPSRPSSSNSAPSRLSRYQSGSLSSLSIPRLSVPVTAPAPAPVPTPAPVPAPVPAPATTHAIAIATTTSTVHPTTARPQHGDHRSVVSHSTETVTVKGRGVGNGLGQNRGQEQGHGHGGQGQSPAQPWLNTNSISPSSKHSTFTRRQSKHSTFDADTNSEQSTQRYSRDKGKQRASPRPHSSPIPSNDSRLGMSSGTPSSLSLATTHSWCPYCVRVAPGEGVAALQIHNHNSHRHLTTNLLRHSRNHSLEFSSDDDAMSSCSSWSWSWSMGSKDGADNNDSDSSLSFDHFALPAHDHDSLFTYSHPLPHLALSRSTDPNPRSRSTSPLFYSIPPPQLQVIQPSPTPPSSRSSSPLSRKRSGDLKDRPLSYPLGASTSVSTCASVAQTGSPSTLSISFAPNSKPSDSRGTSKSIAAVTTSSTTTTTTIPQSIAKRPWWKGKQVEKQEDSLNETRDTVNRSKSLSARLADSSRKSSKRSSWSFFPIESHRAPSLSSPQVQNTDSEYSIGQSDNCINAPQLNHHHRRQLSSIAIGQGKKTERGQDERRFSFLLLEEEHLKREQEERLVQALIRGPPKEPSIVSTIASDSTSVLEKQLPHQPPPQSVIETKEHSLAQKPELHRSDLENEHLISFLSRQEQIEERQQETRLVQALGPKVSKPNRPLLSTTTQKTASPVPVVPAIPKSPTSKSGLSNTRVQPLEAKSPQKKEWKQPPSNVRQQDNDDRRFSFLVAQEEHERQAEQTRIAHILGPILDHKAKAMLATQQEPLSSFMVHPHTHRLPYDLEVSDSDSRQQTTAPFTRSVVLEQKSGSVSSNTQRGVEHSRAMSEVSPRTRVLSCPPQAPATSLVQSTTSSPAPPPTQKKQRRRSFLPAALLTSNLTKFVTGSHSNSNNNNTNNNNTNNNSPSVPVSPAPAQAPRSPQPSSTHGLPTRHVESEARAGPFITMEQFKWSIGCCYREIKSRANKLRSSSPSYSPPLATQPTPATPKKHEWSKPRRNTTSLPPPPKENHKDMRDVLQALLSIMTTAPGASSSTTPYIGTIPQRSDSLLFPYGHLPLSTHSTPQRHQHQIYEISVTRAPPSSHSSSSSFSMGANGGSSKSNLHAADPYAGSELILDPLSVPEIVRLLDLILSSAPEQWIPWHLYDFFIRPQGRRFRDLVELLPTQSQKVLRMILATVDLLIEIAVESEKYAIVANGPGFATSASSSLFASLFHTSVLSPGKTATGKGPIVVGSSHLRSKSDVYGSRDAFTSVPHSPDMSLSMAMSTLEQQQYQRRPMATSEQENDTAAKTLARARQEIVHHFAGLVFRSRQEDVSSSAIAFGGSGISSNSSMSGNSSGKHGKGVGMETPVAHADTTSAAAAVWDQIFEKGKALALSSSSSIPTTSTTAISTSTATLPTFSSGYDVFTSAGVRRRSVPLAAKGNTSAYQGGASVGMPSLLQQSPERDDHASALHAFENLLHAYEDEYHPTRHTAMTRGTQESDHGNNNGPSAQLVGQAMLGSLVLPTPSRSSATSIANRFSSHTTFSPIQENDPSHQRDNTSSSNNVDSSSSRSLSLPPWRKQLPLKRAGSLSTPSSTMSTSKTAARPTLSNSNSSPAVALLAEETEIHLNLKQETAMDSTGSTSVEPSLTKDLQQQHQQQEQQKGQQRQSLVIVVVPQHPQRLLILEEEETVVQDTSDDNEGDGDCQEDGSQAGGGGDDVEALGDVLAQGLSLLRYNRTKPTRALQQPLIKKKRSGTFGSLVGETGGSVAGAVLCLGETENSMSHGSNDDDDVELQQEEGQQHTDEDADDSASDR